MSCGQAATEEATTPNLPTMNTNNTTTTTRRNRNRRRQADPYAPESFWAALAVAVGGAVLAIFFLAIA